MELSLENQNKFPGEVSFTFPRYYRGGKLNNTYYRIFYPENNFYDEENIIEKDTKLKVKIPGANKEKVSVELHTAFINKLNDDFKVYFPETYYTIDSSKIDAEIISKAEEVKNSDPNKPYYYNIGKFVHSHIEYDITYVGRDLTIKEIFDGKKGVCEHYTLLYNAMLNAIGIKTLFISGWSFKEDQTYGDKDTLTHAWTAALIGDKWIELDATWGLFEGVPAGHILKNFFDDRYSYSMSGSTTTEPTFKKIPYIQVITDQEEMKDPYLTEEDNNETGGNNNQESNKNQEESSNNNDNNDKGNEKTDSEDNNESKNTSDNNQNGDNDTNENKTDKINEAKDTNKTENEEISDKSSYINISFGLISLIYLSFIL